MNVEMIREIADAIEKDPEAYDQRSYGRSRNDEAGAPCGTAGCVAGFAWSISKRVVVLGTRTFDFRKWVQDRDRDHLLCNRIGRSVLDIDQGEANALFDTGWPSWWFKRAGAEGTKPMLGTGNWEPDAKQATAVLRWIADLGHMPPENERDLDEGA